MILGENPRAVGTAATLDDLSSRRGASSRVARSGRPAEPSRLHHGSAAHAEFRANRSRDLGFAARLRGLGLQTDSAVAIQLPNTVESAIAFLGVLRAGMIRCHCRCRGGRRRSLPRFGRSVPGPS